MKKGRRKESRCCDYKYGKSLHGYERRIDLLGNQMLELPLNMALRFPNLDLQSLPFAQNLNPELLGAIVALLALGFTAAYKYLTKPPKGNTAHSNYWYLK